MNIRKKIVKKIRKIYNRIRAKRLKNTPTIISKDCIGGVLYSDYNLKFTSPTINLDFSNEDFLKFCEHLKDYISAELVEVINDKYDYPVGRLSTKYGDITLFFRHYDNFEVASSCWNRRKERIDFDNIYIIMCVGPDVEESIINRFESLNYKHKILLSSNIDLTKHSNCYNMECYSKGYKDSLIQHKSKYGIKRYLDEINWIEFLNNKE